jgi:Rha family phage regulatory protein
MNTSVQAVDYSSFVFASNDDIKTTSLLVAEKFGKLHKDVLRKIHTLECSTEFTQRNFAPSEYKDESGKSNTMYEMTKNGFMFLVMGFTGKAAAQIKEAYINAFDLMHAKLFPKAAYALRDLPPAQPKTLTPAMLRHITKRVVWIVNHTAGVSFSSIGGAILDEFNVNERKAIPITKYREVCAFLNCEPDAKALQADLPAPAKVEYQPPKGMMLIAESEFEALNKNAVEFSLNYAKTVLNEVSMFELALVPKKQISELKALLNSIRII